MKTIAILTISGSLLFSACTKNENTSAVPPAVTHFSLYGTKGGDVLDMDTVANMLVYQGYSYPYRMDGAATVTTKPIILLNGVASIRARINIPANGSPVSIMFTGSYSNLFASSTYYSR